MGQLKISKLGSSQNYGKPGKAAADRRVPLGDPPGGQDAHPGPHLLLPGVAPGYSGRSEPAAGGQRGDAAGHRGPLPGHARHSLGLRLRHRRGGGFQPGRRDHLSRRRGLRHQLRGALAAHQVAPGPGAAPDGRIGEHPVQQHSLRGGLPAQRPEAHGRQPEEGPEGRLPLGGARRLWVQPRISTT